MGRKKKSIKRPMEPDPRYHSLLVTRFINNIMVQGKKSLAERNFYQAMDIVEERSGKEPMEVFQKALEILNRFWRSGPAGLAEQPIRSRWKLPRIAEPRWQFDGSSVLPGPVKGCRFLRSWRLK